jgi:hypothetical protein
MASQEFLTFQKFKSAEEAQGLIDILSGNNIEYEAEDAASSLDSTFAGGALTYEIRIKLKGEDFEKVRKLLNDIIKEDINAIEKDYFLFDFSDAELMEVVSQPDEWNPLDYQLAQKILKDRGKEVSQEKAEELKTERLQVLSQPEKGSVSWVITGYITAILGGFLGVYIGWFYLFFKKTLPNGKRVHGYDEQTRKHGRKILLIVLVGMIFCIVYWFSWMKKEM